MPSEMNPEKDLVDLLRELKPSSGRLSSDRVMYEAGKASVSTWVWKVLAMLSMLMSVTLIVALLSRPPRVVERRVYIQVPAAEPVAPAPVEEIPPAYPGLPEMPSVPQGSYLDHRNQVVRWGPEALPSIDPVPDMRSSPMRPIDIYKIDQPDKN